jgi:hypothetical protein
MRISAIAKIEGKVAERYTVCLYETSREHDITGKAQVAETNNRSRYSIKIPCRGIVQIAVG